MDQLGRLRRLAALKRRLLARRAMVSGLVHMAAELTEETDFLKREIADLQIAFTQNCRQGNLKSYHFSAQEIRS